MSDLHLAADGARGVTHMWSPDELEARRARLSPAKRAIVEQRLQRPAAADVLPISRRRATHSAALSFAQQRLWFLQQLEPGSTAYNETLLLHIDGALDVDRLASAINAVVSRHEILRSTYHDSGGTLLQRVHDASAVTVPLPIVDLSSAPDEQRSARAMERARRESETAFDLAAGPLVRTVLLRTGETAFILVQVMHHIVCDGWSMRLFIREAAEMYRALGERRTPALPELPVQYADYAVWQHESLTGGALDAQVEYWRRQLSGIPEAMALPGHRPRVAASGRQSVGAGIEIPDALRASVGALCRTHGVTPFMLLLAAFDVLLYRYTGEHDLVVGIPTAGRVRPELEPLIGFFVNTLAIRTSISGDLTFLELLRQVSATALEAFAHQDLPFDRLVEALQPRRSLTHTPIFQVMFSYENLLEPDEQVPGLRAVHSVLAGGAPKFDLTFTIRESSAGFSGVIEGNADLFEPGLIQRLGAHYVNLLTAIAGAPDLPIGRLDMLAADERRRIVGEWNPGSVRAQQSPSAATPVHRRFEAQVASTPAATALQCGTAMLSYAELNAAANRLASWLRRQGAGPGRHIVVVAERCLDGIAAMLAVWKAGAVYVPVDPSLPEERFQHVLADTAPAIVVRAPFEHMAHEPSGNVAAQTSLDDPAYVIYTSGTTGRPNGIVVGHRALADHCADIVSAYHLSARDRVLHFSSPVFDTAIEQVIPTLLAGACVVLRPIEPPDPQRFPAQLVSDGVTVADLPTAFWRAMVKEAGAGSVPVETAGPPLRLVIAGGEAMASADADLDRRLRLSARLLNAYGPTEATVTATLFEVPDRNAGTIVPIGRPVGRRVAVILDRDGNVVPPGACGELHLGGTGLADGYLNRPELTARSFVRPSVGAELPGDRLYRTGDLAQYRADGIIEFLGRVDDQVKVRGFRVELQDVEMVLREHPLLGDAAVLLHNGGLAAYVTKSSDRIPTVRELRSYMAGRVPDYMVPGSFTILPSLPVTAGGKIDRRALPEPQPESGRGGLPRVSARTQVEAVLSAIWAAALEIDSPSLDDDFFALGGHSLLATQVVARAREAFACDIPLRWVFETPTIAGLAARIESSSPGKRLPPIRRAARETVTPLSIAQEEFWVADRALPGAPFFKISTAVRLAGTIDETALARSFSVLVGRHEALRTTFSMADGKPVQVVNPPWPFTLEVFDLRFFPESEREEALSYLVTDFAQHRFDLAHGPLIRAGLVALNDAEQVVLLTMHHIIGDGWSLGILARELEALYPRSTGRAAILPELPVQYRDFAVWQREALQAGVFDSQLEYWKTTLGGVLPPLPLPVDRDRPEVRSFRYGRERIRLSPALERSLETTAAGQGATLYMAMLAGFKALLAGLTARTDIRVGTIAASRNAVELEHVVGLFINTLVLRTDLSGDPSYEDALRRVRRVTLEAFENEEVPFEHVRAAIEAGAPGTLPSLFQILFLFESPRLAPHGLGGLARIEGPTTAETHEVLFSTFDWIVEVNQEEPGLTVQLKYDADLYEPSTVRSLLRRFEALLESAVQDPTLTISQLRDVSIAGTARGAAWER